jgi:hypothetical protein
VLLGEATAAEELPAEPEPTGEEPAAEAEPDEELQAARAAASVRPAATHVPLARRERDIVGGADAGDGVNCMKGV